MRGKSKNQIICRLDKRPAAARPAHAGLNAQARVPRACSAERVKKNEKKMLESAKLIGAGLATIGSGGAGIGVGSVFASLVLSTARNPSLKQQLFSFAILGFALTEAVGLFALMMSFLILYAF